MRGECVVFLGYMWYHMGDDKFRFIELLAEMQKVVQREQGTGNREQEKPRTGRYNQAKV